MVQLITWEAEFIDVLKVLFAVALCPQIADAAAPETILDTQLDSLREKTPMMSPCPAQKPIQNWLAGISSNPVQQS